MNAFSSSCDRSLRAAEKPRFGGRVFISKYELRMITIKVHQFHDRETRYYSTETFRVILTRSTVST
jgi:hypothetical protein